MCAAPPTQRRESLGVCVHDAASKHSTGLAKFWKEGKRMLDINEIADLNADDKDTCAAFSRLQRATLSRPSCRT